MSMFGSCWQEKEILDVEKAAAEQAEKKAEEKETKKENGKALIEMAALLAAVRETSFERI